MNQSLLLTSLISLSLLSSGSAADTWPLQTRVGAVGTNVQDAATLPRPTVPAALPVKGPPPRSGLESRKDGGWTLVGPWKLAEAPKVSATAEQISAPEFDASSWYAATVPGTVLTTLVNQGVYPDPYFGLNNLVIPESLNRQDYWYRLEFTPPTDAVRHRCTLLFNAINYRAEVWLNGQRLGEIKGGFIRGPFDVSGQLKPREKNVLAVRLAPTPRPGIPHEQSIKAGPGDNGGTMCLDGPTFFPTEGWDWIPAIRDRDAGIWQEVALIPSGDVLLGDPQVITKLPLPDTSSADVRIAVEVKNPTQTEQRGWLKGSFEGVKFEKQVELLSQSSQTVTFSPEEFPQLRLKHPRLWWPNGYGKPELYHLKLTFVNPRGAESDRRELRFGVREMSYELTLMDKDRKPQRVEFMPSADVAAPQPIVDLRHQALVKFNEEIFIPSFGPGATTSPALRPIADSSAAPHMVLKVNGVRVIMKGGNWGMDDAMKNVSRERLEPYVRLHRDANLTLIRNWCGQSTEEAFYDLCDEYGLLVLNELWATTQDWNFEPEDVPLFLANTRDTLLHYRTHPCIAFWCGRNEGVPQPPLNEGIETLIRTLDGTRFYLPSSRYVSATGSGPWRYQPDLSGYFTKLGQGLSTEMGLPSVPTLDAMKSFLAPADWWPITDAWAYHDWHTTGNGDVPPFMKTMEAQLGAATGLEDFVRKSQLLCYAGHRALYEGMNARLFKPNTARILWMSHPAWPSMVWQLYSWDYDPNGSFSGAQKACEPVHVQMNLPDHTVAVINNPPAPLAGAKVSARVFDAYGKVLWEKSAPLNAAACDTAEAFKVEWPAEPLAFLRLELHDAKGRLLSENFYWHGAKAEATRALNQLPAIKLATKVKSHRENGERLVTVELHNPGPTLALMTHLSLRDREGNRILPFYASENYLSLLPGERRTVRLVTPVKEPKGGFHVRLDGWNVWEQMIR